MKITMQDVADAVGVSRMTISNAYSRPDKLSAALRERIFEAARTLGYTGPDAAARAFARGSTGVVGIILTDTPAEAFVDEVAVSLMAAIADQLADRGLAMALVPGRVTADRVPARDLALDGAIGYGCSADSAAFGLMIGRRVPLVTVDQPPVDGVPAVNIDDYGGARQAAEHLARLGHRRVAAVTVAMDQDVAGHAAERLRGWRDGLADRELQVAARPGTLTEAHGYELARSVLDSPERPTAVVCFSDTAALGVLRAADDVGLSVPEDLSVVGFDDSTAAARAGLSTVHQDVPAKGRAAVQALYEVMDADDTAAADPNPRILLPTQLTPRTSTAPPRRPAAPDRSGR
ncbi:MAG TPA: LacI family DNA-binding transcriptional regulator [Jatrophihabitans sp.]|jgi:DNA-binding LacI/PurR family transcriptional regulator